MSTKRIIWGSKEGERWEIDGFTSRRLCSIVDTHIQEKSRIVNEMNSSINIHIIPFKKIKLTPMNAHDYIGYKIEFTSMKRIIVKRIINVAASGKSIRIDFPYLKNGLVVGAGRNIYVIGIGI